MGFRKIVRSHSPQANSMVAKGLTVGHAVLIRPSDKGAGQPFDELLYR